VTCEGCAHALALTGGTQAFRCRHPQAKDKHAIQKLGLEVHWTEARFGDWPRDFNPHAIRKCGGFLAEVHSEEQAIGATRPHKGA